MTKKHPSKCMHLVVYISRYNRNKSEIQTDLREIISVARTNNQRNNITGLLMFLNGQFMQILEGDKETIHELVKRIKKDKRHSDLLIVVDEPQEGREFPDWNMRGLEVKNENAFDSEMARKLNHFLSGNIKINGRVFLDLITQALDDEKFLTLIENFQ